jgi:hypothetical protein
MRVGTGVVARMLDPDDTHDQGSGGCGHPLSATSATVACQVNLRRNGPVGGDGGSRQIDRSELSFGAMAVPKSAR